MPFAQMYKSLIEKEINTSASRLKVNKLYKIHSYTTVDGEQKTYAGAKAAIIFLVGIYEKKLYAIKITEVKPNDFFKWLKPTMLKNIKADEFDERKPLAEYLKKADKSGKQIFSGFLKGKPIYAKEPNVFRTYYRENVKQISEVILKPDVLKNIYGLPVTANTSKEKISDKNPIKTKEESKKGTKEQISQTK